MKRYLLFLGLAACLAMAMPAPASSAQKTIRLKMATQYMDRHVVYKSVYKSWIDEIKKRTNGRVIITYYNPNTLVPYTGILDATLKGRVDIGDQYMDRDVNRFPLTTVNSKIPVLTTTVLSASMALWELYQTTPAIKAEFKGLKVLGLHHTANMQLSTKDDKPVRKAEDIKGMRIASPSDVASDIIKALGGSTVSQPVPELYMALSRNMAEGVIFPIPPMRSFKVDEATKYITFYDFVSGPCWLAMNQAKWDSLPPDIQKIFEETTGEVITRAMATAIDNGVDADTAAMKKGGHVLIYPRPADKAHVAKILSPVLLANWKENLARTECKYPDPDGLYKKACELMKKYDALYGRKN